MEKRIILLCICMVLISACGSQAEQTISDDTETSSVTTSAESVSEITTTEQTISEQTTASMTETENVSETAEITTTVDLEISNLVLSRNNTGKKQYSWHVEPTIEAKHIDNIVRSYTYYGDPVFSTSWYNKFFCSENNDGRLAVIDIDGNLCTEYKFDHMYYGWYGCVLVNNHNENGEIAYGYESCELYDDGSLSDYHHDEYYQQTTNGAGELFIPEIGDSYGDKIIMCSDGFDGTVNGPSICALRKISLEMTDDDSGFSLYRWDRNKYDFKGGYSNWTNDISEKYALVSYSSYPETVTDFIFEDTGNFICEVIPMKKDGKWGYLNRYGETVIPFEYDAAWFPEEYKIAYEGNRAGTSEYIKARDASEYYVVLCKDGEYALVTTAYEEVIPFGEFDYITSVFQGKAWVKDKESGFWGVIKIDR